MVLRPLSLRAHPSARHPPALDVIASLHCLWESEDLQVPSWQALPCPLTLVQESQRIPPLCTASKLPSALSERRSNCCLFSQSPKEINAFRSETHYKTCLCFVAAQHVSLCLPQAPSAPHVVRDQVNLVWTWALNFSGLYNRAETMLITWQVNTDYFPSYLPCWRLPGVVTWTWWFGSSVERGCKLSKIKQYIVLII